MQKIFTIVLTIVTIAVSSYRAYADTYRIISIKGCTATIDNDTIREGDVVPTNAKFKVTKATEGASWIIKLQSTTTGKIHPLCSASSSTDSGRDDSESWISSFWNTLIGQKKCSTRAPENELANGLSHVLSQTFYLFYPYDNDSSSNIDFASNLNNRTVLRCSYHWAKHLYMFDIPIIDGMFSLSSKSFAFDPTEERTILKIDVKCILENGEIVPITDSMNVVLINLSFSGES